VWHNKGIRKADTSEEVAEAALLRYSAAHSGAVAAWGEEGSGMVRSTTRSHRNPGHYDTKAVYSLSLAYAGRILRLDSSCVLASSFI